MMDNKGSLTWVLACIPFPPLSRIVYTCRQEIYSRLINIMKEIEKAQIKLLSDRLDLIRRQMASMQLTSEVEKHAELEKEKATLEIEIARLKAVRNKKLSKEAQKLVDMPFKRPITKKEQADLGKLKKSVRGLTIVHPMTALGREMELDVMTGFSKADF